ncbi:MAG TPA: U32 family peptidase [Luteitalea sp.]|nr:U32 family peptidase [Luteitalea sp.]
MTAARVLQALSLPEGDAHALPSSPHRFADGGQYRIEIPSVEGPRVLAAVLEEASTRHVPIHRVSQGSGIMLLTDAEIREMCDRCRHAHVELSLFVGPRAGWDTGATVVSPAGRTLGAQLRGQDQVRHALDDVLRAAALGVRSVLIADLGLLRILDLAKQAGHLPADLVVKISVQLAAANPLAVAVLADEGATTINVPTDLSLAHLAAIRQHCDVPLDVYVEVPDGFGGFVRHYEIPALIDAVSPVYVKFGLRNAPDIYPSGLHLETMAINMARERVRRAELGLALLQRHVTGTGAAAPVMSPVGVPGAPGIPAES